jgi:putative ABC transport system ATP-binding protein
VIEIPRLIDVSRLTKTYDRRTEALHRVSFSVRKGEWVSVMGPSGSGKTTLLNILGCLDSPSSGTVTIGDKTVTGMSHREATLFRSRNIGLVFQQYHLIPHLTTLENVLMAQYFAGSVDEDDARDVLQRVGMGDRLDHPPTHLSGGEQQRVCIARALVNAPQLLLADEPTGNLDSENGRKVLRLLKELHDDGRTIIMVTHSQEVASLSDRVLRLVDARLFSDTSIKALRGAPVPENEKGGLGAEKAHRKTGKGLEATG